MNPAYPSVRVSSWLQTHPKQRILFLHKPDGFDSSSTSCPYMNPASLLIHPVFILITNPSNAVVLTPPLSEQTLLVPRQKRKKKKTYPPLCISRTQVFKSSVQVLAYIISWPILLRRHAPYVALTCVILTLQCPFHPMSYTGNASVQVPVYLLSHPHAFNRRTLRY